MPLQNRVDPAGQLIFTPARGMLMGNRGKIHNKNKEVFKPWDRLAWITCETQFKGIKREDFGANTYSELFFLDEATALSAGHRPCSDCRKPRLVEFKALWNLANSGETLPHDSSKAVRVSDIDEQLHAERISSDGRKLTFDCLYGDVPSGVFILRDGKPHLRWMERLLLWTPEGYLPSPISLSEGDIVTVLTPTSIFKMMALGFIPKVHASAEIG